jgi:hypothetical protein
MKHDFSVTTQLKNIGGNPISYKTSCEAFLPGDIGLHVVYLIIKEILSVAVHCHMSHTDYFD